MPETEATPKAKAPKAKKPKAPKAPSPPKAPKVPKVKKAKPLPKATVSVAAKPPSAKLPLGAEATSLSLYAPFATADDFKASKVMEKMALKGFNTFSGVTFSIAFGNDHALKIGIRRKSTGDIVMHLDIYAGTRHSTFVSLPLAAFNLTHGVQAYSALYTEALARIKPGESGTVLQDYDDTLQGAAENVLRYFKDAAKAKHVKAGCECGNCIVNAYAHYGPDAKVSPARPITCGTGAILRRKLELALMVAEPGKISKYAELKHEKQDEITPDEAALIKEMKV